jgi:hypothetical protein
VVVVRGERVPDRVARLTRGQRLFVPARAEADADAEAVADADADADAEAHADADADAVTDADADADAVTDAEARADAVADAVVRPRARRAAPTVATPSLRSDISSPALSSPDLSSPDLSSPRRGRGGDVPLDVAALEEFTLGRVEMDERHRPARARAALERAIALGLPRRLEEQARQRLESLPP